MRGVIRRMLRLKLLESRIHVIFVYARTVPLEQTGMSKRDVPTTLDRSTAKATTHCGTVGKGDEDTKQLSS